MKVLQINSVCGIGSTGRIATDLYHMLAKKGHRCKIAYGRGEAKNIPREDAVPIGGKQGVYTHALLSRITDRSGFYSAAATRKLIGQIKDFDPDVIHLHNLHGYYISLNPLFRFLKEAHKPVVWTLYDCWSFTGHCAHFDYNQCSGWKTGCRTCKHKEEYPKSSLFSASAKNYDQKKMLYGDMKNLNVVTPSAWLNAMARQSFFSSEQITVLPNGIDLKQFISRQSDLRERYHLGDAFLILGVASVWTDKKGLRHFIELSKRLSAGQRIVLVGISPKQKKELPSSILGIERTHSVQELCEFYTSADVFVNPTLEETQGLTNLEALACGTPVITFDSGGAAESICEECGISVPRDDTDGLWKAICQVREKIRTFDAEKCRDQAMRYDMDVLYQQYLELYQRVMEEGVPKGEEG